MMTTLRSMTRSAEGRALVLTLLATGFISLAMICTLSLRAWAHEEEGEGSSMVDFDTWAGFYGIDQNADYYELRNPNSRVPYLFIYLNEREPDAIDAAEPTMWVDASGAIPGSHLTLQAAWDAADDGAIVAVLPGTYEGFDNHSNHSNHSSKSVLFLGMCVDWESPRIISTISVADNEGVVMLDGFIVGGASCSPAGISPLRLRA